jgi:hypothetical protein
LRSDNSVACTDLANELERRGELETLTY